MSATDSFKTFAGRLLAIFLAIFGAHCWLVWLYGSELPFWDQWDEALTVQTLEGRAFDVDRRCRSGQRS